jgi:hypothetical protein
MSTFLQNTQHLMLSGWLSSIQSGFPVITAWGFLTLRMEHMASRYGRCSRTCWTNSRGQPTKDAPQVRSGGGYGSCQQLAVIELHVIIKHIRLRAPGILWNDRKQRKVEVRSRIWNARSLYIYGPLQTVLRDLSKHVTFSGSTEGQTRKA